MYTIEIQSDHWARIGSTMELTVSRTCPTAASVQHREGKCCAHLGHQEHKCKVCGERLGLLDSLCTLSRERRFIGLITHYLIRPQEE